jgi:hypothetical protein
MKCYPFLLVVYVFVLMLESIPYKILPKTRKRETILESEEIYLCVCVCVCVCVFSARPLKDKHLM